MPINLDLHCDHCSRDIGDIDGLKVMHESCHEAVMEASFEDGKKEGHDEGRQEMKEELEPEKKETDLIVE